MDGATKITTTAIGKRQDVTRRDRVDAGYAAIANDRRGH